MGYKNSKLIDAIPGLPNFTSEEIYRLRKCFMKLDTNNLGSIDTCEFFSIPQIAKNPLATRLFAVVDEDGDGNMDFEELLRSLSLFSSKGHKMEKLRFAFKIYDMDRDGYISNGELFLVLKMMTRNNLKDRHLQQIVDKTIMEADKDKDGKISFEEFTQMITNTDITENMLLDSNLY